MARLTNAEWKAEEEKSGKSCLLMREFEKIAAYYGENSLHNWQIHCGLRQGKPRYRVKATSISTFNGTATGEVK